MKKLLVITLLMLVGCEQRIQAEFAILADRLCEPYGGSTLLRVHSDRVVADCAHEPFLQMTVYYNHAVNTNPPTELLIETDIEE